MSKLFPEKLILRAENIVFGADICLIGLATDLDVISYEEWEEYADIKNEDEVLSLNNTFACFVLAATGKL